MRSLVSMKGLMSMNGKGPSLTPVFSYNFLSGLISSILGGGSTTISTDADGTFFDWEGLIRPLPAANCARMDGFRYVRNICSTSVISDWATTSNVTVSAGVADPNGGTSAFTLTATGASAFHADEITAKLTLATNQVVNSIWIRRRTGVGAIIIYNGGNAAGSTAVTATLTTSWQRIAVGPTAAGAVAFNYIGIGIATSGDAVDVVWPQSEVVDGQSNLNPSEYVSVGILAAPYHGAGVDGVKFFPYANPNTVASNVVTEGAVSTTAVRWAKLPGRAGNYISTPDSVANSITGDIDIRAHVALPDWTTSGNKALVVKRQSGDGSYQFYLTSAGELAFYSGVGVGTSTANLSALPGLSAKWLRVTRVAATGVFNFFTSDDDVTWTALGAPVAGAAGALVDTADIVEVGALATGTLDPVDGRIFRAQIYNGINGTLAVDFNANDFTAGGSSAVSSTTGETWTVNTSGTPFPAVIQEAFTPATIYGLHAEPAATNSLISSRDFTNAAWAAVNVTPAKTQTGIDGVPSSCSLLTATAANGTILQALVLAAAARSFSVYVKRSVGAGVIEITRDGVTFTDITALIGASEFARVSILNDSVLNPVIGFRLVASGDAIIVDAAQDEAGEVATSVIFTAATAVTRSADEESTALGPWFNVLEGSFAVEFMPGVAATYAADQCVIDVSDGTANERMSAIRVGVTAVGNFTVVDGGATQASISLANASTTSAISKQVIAYRLNDFATALNGGTIGTDVAGTLPTVVTLYLGRLGSGSGHLNGWLRTLDYYPSRLANGVVVGESA